jgi:hypothetical protein
MVTPTLDNKTMIITPDDLLSLPGLVVLSTPDSEDFCKHLPSPQIVVNPDKFSILSGRFVLCPQESWPSVMNMAMDLDTGSFVSRDDKRADIDMQSTPWWSLKEPSYGLDGRNNAYISDAYVLQKYANHSGMNNLSYKYCNNLVESKTDTSAFLVEEGAIACVRTTEGQIAIIRVEKYYPPNTLSVEFSFAILNDK